MSVTNEETKIPILQTILLIEDRIAEIQESNDKTQVKRSVTARGKPIFLQELLERLQRFYNGNF